ncbi:hypothetical protein Tco_0778835 [Tanacetum coccineum]
MPAHNRIYIVPSHTKKIFRNMRRVGKGFSGSITPLFPNMVVHNQEEMGEGSAMPTDPYHTPTIIQPSTSQPKKTQKPRRPKRKDTQVPQSSIPSDNVADEAVNEEMDDSLVRAATTTSSLEAEHDSGNILKTRSKATPNEPSSPGNSLGSGPKRQETMRDTIAQTRFENVSKLSNDPLLARVIDQEKTKTSQAQEITSLKRRVKRLEKKGGSRTHGLKNYTSTHFDADTYMFGVHDLVGDEVVVESEVVVKAASTIPVSAATTTTTVITNDEITLAKALAKLKSAKLPTTTAATTITADKGKGKMVKLEPVKKLSKKNQLMLDEELAFRLQGEEEEEERLAKEKAQQIKELREQREEEQTTNNSSTKEFHVTELVEESSKKAEAEIAQESSSKRASIELEKESIKKQKVNEDKETAKLQRLIEIVFDEEEVALDAIPLAIKPLSIVDYKIYKKGKKTYYQIIRGDGS